MRKQAVNQAFENNSMEVALEGLGKSIARWTVLDGDRIRPRFLPCRFLGGTLPQSR